MLLLLNKYYCWAPWSVTGAFRIVFYSTFLTWPQFSHEKTTARQNVLVVALVVLYRTWFCLLFVFSQILVFFSIVHMLARGPVEASRRPGSNWRPDLQPPTRQVAFSIKIFWKSQYFGWILDLGPRPASKTNDFQLKSFYKINISAGSWIWGSRPAPKTIDFQLKSF